MIRTFALAASLLFASSSVFAACSVDIEGNDAMQFNLKTIDVDKTCKDFTVNLKHTGKMAKNVMGHNWVLTTTADMQGAATDGMSAGLDKDYLKAGDTRVIAHTRMIGGGESASVTFDVAKLKDGGPFKFFCTFPGHLAVMQGSLQVG